MDVSAAFLAAVCLTVSVSASIQDLLPGQVLVHNWVKLEVNYVDRYRYICQKPEAFKCIRDKLFRANGEPWDDIAGDLDKSIRPNNVFELICWWPVNIPEFNVMFKTKYSLLTADPALSRNYSVWDVDRIFSLYPRSVFEVRKDMVGDFLKAGRFGQYVGSNKGAKNFFAIMSSMWDARPCIERASNLRW